MDRVNFERSVTTKYSADHYKLSRMTALLGLLDNPQHAQPVVHIAGTKGKGSVAWLTAESLRAAGHSVGLYTSPHLLDLRERFVLNGNSCSESQLIEATQTLARIEPQLIELNLGPPTFFELTTAIAWLLFAQSKVSIAVVEVGMGGRLDSTNVCQPLLSIITSISLDHQQHLGSTIELIAAEKAGIIKPGVPVINAAGSLSARNVVRRVAMEHQAPTVEQDIDFDFSWSMRDQTSPLAKFRYQPISAAVSPQTAITTQNEDAMWPTMELGMLGRHQGNNAAIACAALQSLRQAGWEIPVASVITGLRDTQVTARVQVCGEQPTLIVDSAHNAVSATALINTLQQHFRPSYKILVFASSSDKDFRMMLEQWLSYFDEIILTCYESSFRSATTEQLRVAAESVKSAATQESSRGLHTKLSTANTPAEAIDAARATCPPDGLICAAGSFYLAAEILPLVTQ
jgi:dihydrofolate synthase/folylpolyglutamate synthase